MKKIIFNKFKSLNKKQKRTIIGLSIFILLFIFLLIQNINFTGKFISSGSSIQSTINEIRMLKKDLHNKMLKYNKIKDKEKLYSNNKNDFMILTENMNINEIIQQKMETNATNSKVTLNSIGNIERNKINTTLSSGNLNISCKGSIKNMTNFISKIYTIKPKMYLTNSSLTASMENQKKNVRFTAGLKFYIINKAIKTNSTDSPL
jgi:hypothetical protein